MAVTGTIGLLDYALKSEWIDKREALEIARRLQAAGFRVKAPSPSMPWLDYLLSLNLGEL